MSYSTTLNDATISLGAPALDELSFGHVSVRTPTDSFDYTYGTPTPPSDAWADTFHLFCLGKPVLILAAVDAAERAGITPADRVGRASEAFGPTRIGDITVAAAFAHRDTLDAPRIDDIILRQPEWVTTWRTGVRSLAAATGYTDWCSSALAVDIIESVTGIGAAEVLNNLSDRLDVEIAWGQTSSIATERQLSYVEYSGARSPLRLDGFWTPEIGSVLDDPTVSATGTVASLADWAFALGEFVFHDGAQPPGVPTAARDLRRAPAKPGSERTWQLGVATNLDAHAIAGFSSGSIGHVGWMGRSFVAYDPDARLAIASMNPGYDARRLEAVEQHRAAIISDAIRSVMSSRG